MKISLFLTFLSLTSVNAFATTYYTCTSVSTWKNNPNHILALTILDDDIINPAVIMLEGALSDTAFKLKYKKDERAESWGLNRYVGKRSLRKFSQKPIQQTVFLSKDRSEKSDKVLEVVTGGENISYKKYSCLLKTNLF